MFMNSNFRPKEPTPRPPPTLARCLVYRMIAVYNTFSKTPLHASIPNVDEFKNTLEEGFAALLEAKGKANP